jgi:mRNA interferase MazF
MKYTPSRGHLIWLNFTPKTGHEQAGRRLALVISPEKYNKKVGLAILCPITNQIKNYPFEVKISDGLGVTGVILSDQVKSLDWQARKAEFIQEIPKDVVDEVLQKLNTLIG